MTCKKLSMLLLVSAFFVQGCSNKNNTTANVQASQENPSPTLQRCINQATILMKMNKKYEKNYSQLYALINNAKYYASISKDTAETVNATISPLLEYKINNTCNTISQLLIQEFKNKIDQEGLLVSNMP